MELFLLYCFKYDILYMGQLNRKVGDGTFLFIVLLHQIWLFCTYVHRTIVVNFHYDKLGGGDGGVTRAMALAYKYAECSKMQKYYRTFGFFFAKHVEGE